MAAAKLIIAGPSGTEEILLDPQGITLGRSLNCDLVLEHDSVSRHHARIYQDPFGRWIVEDLESRNGVLVDGQLIKAHAILPDQKINIANFVMSLSEESDREAASGSSIRSAIPIVDKGPEEDIVSYRPDRGTVLSPALMQQLNELTDRLLKLTSPSELYAQACLHLANILDTLVAIVRLPGSSEALPHSPDILACRFSSGEAEPGILPTSNLHLSKRVLDAVRSADIPVMASSRPSAGQKLELTVVDENEPHVVFAARVNDLGETVDALYLDMLQDKAPKEMFDFMEAVARQINFVQKTLFFTELQKREKSLREANIQLREKDHIKDEYVSRVTHDIKGHLTAIQGSLRVAFDESSGPLNDQQTDFLRRACRRSAKLSDFVKELLDLTQMRLSGHFKMAPFSLAGSISDAMSAIEREAEEKSITVTSKVRPSVGLIVGNQFSINEMLTNLLFNAIEYTPEKKSVHIEVKSRGDSVQIDISDTGIGIPEDEIGSIFDEFYRAGNAREWKKDSTGLGLSIVKQIIERHSGEISVQSRLGQGTTFTIILPKGNPIQA